MLIDYIQAHYIKYSCYSVTIILVRYDFFFVFVQYFSEPTACLASVGATNITNFLPSYMYIVQRKKNN